MCNCSEHIGQPLCGLENSIMKPLFNRVNSRRPPLIPVARPVLVTLRAAWSTARA
jgi:hypothetical protein